MGYTNPQIVAEAGCPPFKTQKILGSRAIATDTFSWRHFDPRPEYGSDHFTLEPGLGWYAHKEGYNVLYGDWHVKWYGDPQSTIMWPEQDNTSLTNSDRDNEAAMWRDRSGNVITIWTSFVDDTREWNRECSMTEWHVFDMAGGVDMDATAPAPSP